MYASDVSNRKRSQAVFADLKRQKEWFNDGNSIRINYQKGGNDYAYLYSVEQGCINNECSYGPRAVAKKGNYLASMNTSGYDQIDLSVINDNGYDVSGNVVGTNPHSTLDDATIGIPFSGDFYFFGNAYTGAATSDGIVYPNAIHWNTNNVLVFSNSNISPRPDDLNFLSTTCPAILLGNYDRRLDNLYTQSYSNSLYSVTSLLVFYENFWHNSSPNEGQYQVRLIRENVLPNRQWIEVSVKTSTANSGYCVGQWGVATLQDSSKLSPYNITDGTTFMNPCGTTFSVTPPASGTSFVFESDSQGRGWFFRNNTYIDTSIY